ncbi:hypothetical protein EJ05DRAFT_535495 [Pseudovirgaria hyperparasitica]|uniref:Uncharacterized protein n=1 Tax=Pseudovirgaria hyperparasitica TaxID=470096 RepID=A0A6A6WJB9_9PEZI|nr:uncharacterized protein EJ05DRAFT_535495 [Pseudovirgaria hyperparasitica]KAF2762250.1 hypothetical protein EJ05DRAFT_535495 [Pseudovirgaria hyperparasitica]
MLTFLDLPKNVRMQTYSLLCPTIPVPPGLKGVQTLRHDGVRCSVTFLRSNRAIYKEAGHFLYTSTAYTLRYNNATCLFYFINSIYDASELHSLMSRLRKVRKLIFEIRLGDDMSRAETRQGLSILYGFAALFGECERELQALQLKVFPVEDVMRKDEIILPSFSFAELALACLVEMGQVNEVTIEAFCVKKWMRPEIQPANWGEKRLKWERLVSDMSTTLMEGSILRGTKDWLERINGGQVEYLEGEVDSDNE